MSVTKLPNTRKVELKKKTHLKGKDWVDYLVLCDYRNIIQQWDAQMKLYSGVTYKHQNINKIGKYYFVFGILGGYQNVSSLKKLFVAMPSSSRPLH